MKNLDKNIGKFFFIVERTHLAEQNDFGEPQFETSQKEEDQFHHFPAIALEMNERNPNIYDSSSIPHKVMEQYHLLQLSLLDSNTLCHYIKPLYFLNGPAKQGEITKDVNN